MPFKLTVMGQVQTPPGAFQPTGSLVLYPISPPVRVGNYWAMPRPWVAQWDSAVEWPQLEAIVHAAGLAAKRPFTPPRPEDIPPDTVGLRITKEHVIWPFDPQGTRHELYKLEEQAIVQLIYFVANQSRVRLGIVGEEIEIDCSWAEGTLGLAAATWDGRVGRMALLYCAATDAGLVVTETTNDVERAPEAPSATEPGISIAAGMRSALTPNRLLASTGSLLLHIPASAPDASLFRVMAAGFSFEAEISNGRLIMRRNGKEIGCPLAAEQPPPSPPGPPPTILVWAPGVLKMFTVEEKSEVATVAAFVPQALIDWAQRESIAPVIHYESPQDFFGTVVAAIAGVQEKIVEASMQSAFWDETRGARGRIERTVPKREVEIQPTIEGLLRDVGIAKSFKVLREPSAAGGALDFYFVGSLKGGGLVGVCMELKHAHSGALFDGLEKQLPAYMKNKGAEFGVYGVLWFKGDEFDEPTGDVLQLQTELHRRRLSLPHNIVIEIFDLTRPVPPSKQS